VVVVAAAVALAVAVAAAAVEDGGGDIVARRGGVVVVVVVLSVVSNSPKKEMLESLLYSLLSLRQKRKTALSRVCFLRIPFVLLSPRGGGGISLFGFFLTARGARARRVAFFKMMDSRSLRMSFSCCLGFVSKKLGKKTV